jgi:hypothetical protein
VCICIRCLLKPYFCSLPHTYPTRRRQRCIAFQTACLGQSPASTAANCAALRLVGMNTAGNADCYCGNNDPISSSPYDTCMGACNALGECNAAPPSVARPPRLGLVLAAAMAFAAGIAGGSWRQ